MQHGFGADLMTIILVVTGSLPVVFLPRLLKWMGSRYHPFVWSYFVISRVFFLIVLVLVFGRAVGPDRATWILHGESALKGLWPYIDYPSEYGPLFSFLLLPAFACFPANVAALVVFIIFDALVVLLMQRLGEPGGPARLAAAYYLVSPLSWFMIVRWGQDEVIGACALVGLLLLDQRGRRWSVDFLTFLATLATKILFPLAAGAVILRRPRAWLHCALIAVLIALAYFPFILFSGNVALWSPSSPMRCGPNIWQLAAGIGQVSTPVALAVTMMVVAAIGLIGMRKGERISVVALGLGIFGGLMLFSPKAWPPYSLLFLPLMCLGLAQSSRLHHRVLFAAYGVLMNLYILVYPQLWSPTGMGRHLLAQVVLLLLVISHGSMVAVFIRKSVN